MTRVIARHLRAVQPASMDTFAGSQLPEFELYLRANDCGDCTIHYRLAHLADFARIHPDFPNVTPMQITAWLGRPGYAPWSRATYYGHLHSYFKFATDAGIVHVDPMARLRRPKQGQCTPRPLGRVQVHTVMAAAPNANVRAWLTLGLYAGLRAFEIAKFRGEDIEQDQMFIHGKGGRDDYVPTHPVIWALTASRPATGWWFPVSLKLGHVSARSVSEETGKLFAAHGISGSIHRTRHTFATELLRSGVNVRVVQTLMRHASLNSTMVYTAVDEHERRDAISHLVIPASPLCAA